jgi:Flp pilus assembly pilin Flp
MKQTLRLSFRQQSGSALIEYLAVAAAMVLVLIVYEQTPNGLIHALKAWHAQFFWALSVPF